MQDLGSGSAFKAISQTTSRWLTNATASWSPVPSAIGRLIAADKQCGGTAAVRRSGKPLLLSRWRLSADDQGNKHIIDNRDGIFSILSRRVQIETRNRPLCGLGRGKVLGWGGERDRGEVWKKKGRPEIDGARGGGEEGDSATKDWSFKGF